MKICLVNPPINQYYAVLDLPLALLILCAIAKEMGCEVEIIDFNLLTKHDPHFPLCDSFFEAAIDRIGRSLPDLIGITCLSSSLPFALEIAERYRARYPGGKIILGGPQATLLHDKLLQRCPYIDIVCRGEGEETLRDLIASNNNPSKVAGLSYRNYGNEVVINPAREMLADLDRSPYPDYDLIDVKSYEKLSPLIPLQIETGRGCPYRCAYCSTSRVWGNRFRLKSAERIVAEIRTSIEKTGIKNIHFIHDLFSHNKEWVFDLCRRIRAEDLPVTWSCDTRIDEITPEMLAEMSAAGCRGLFFGIESRSARMQKVFHKVFDPDQTMDMLQCAVQKGISATVSFILGYPCETAEDLEETLEFIILLTLSNTKTGVVINAFMPEYATESYEIYSSGMKVNPVMLQKDLPFRTPAITARIERDAELFSHFYYVANSHYDYAWVEKFYLLMPLVTRLDWPIRLTLGHPHLRYMQVFEDLYQFVKPAMRMDEYRRPNYDAQKLGAAIRSFQQHMAAKYGARIDMPEPDEQFIDGIACFLNQHEESGRGVHELM